MQNTSLTAGTLIKFESTTFCLGGRQILPGTDWEIKTDENWVVIGPNGSGKSVLMRALMGEVPVCHGRILRRDDMPPAQIFGYISFERHRHLIAREERKDHARYFSGLQNQGNTVLDYLRSQSPHPGINEFNLTDVALKLDIDPLLSKEIRCLSTGEIRKMLIAGALIKSPRLLILDEPFVGLDRSSRSVIREILEGLIRNHTHLVLITHRPDEIPGGMTHVLCLKKGRIAWQGTIGSMPVKEIMGPDRVPETDSEVRTRTMPPSDRNGFPEHKTRESVLIRMKNVRVVYENTVIINDLNWVMKSGENWAITGPNGSGKTTLLRLIAADHLQAYANEIYLFGKRRGSGESIWEIRRRIGWISAEVQLGYRKQMSVTDVVLSGFFDSVGLYQKSTPSQIAIARQWLEILGIEEMADRRFNRLSHGEQRMVLLARAMVKSPLLLILDEPCQGLDPANRRKILKLIHTIGRNPRTHLLYVTHHEAEIPSCITHVLNFTPSSDGHFRHHTMRLGVVEWDKNRRLLSPEFSDIYFSEENGREEEESRHVFLNGNHLPERWNDCSRFTIIETGFGTGLNFLATWRLWRDHASPGHRLHYISIEKYPLRKADLVAIFKRWPDLKPFSRRLLRHYPDLRPGLHRIAVENDGIRLSLVFDDVDTMSSYIDTAADAWFLDGFNPSCNPEMWTDDLFEAMAMSTRPGGTFATYTSAGFVKRGLRSNGFAVERVKGFGRKRHMLRGYFKGLAPLTPVPR